MRNHVARTYPLQERASAVERLDRRFGLPLTVLILACSVLAVSPLSADTVFLKDGTQILDCQVTSETDTIVYLRTPAGDMGVPRTQIYRIQRVKTVYDTYKDQLAGIREGDANGYFKLALWCRNVGGLRKESDELLAKVISLVGNNTRARRMLGHVKLGREWVVPEPLSIELRVDTVHANDLRMQLDLLLKTRKDVRLAPESASKPGPASKSDGGAGIDKCTFEASVIVTRKAGSRLYGRTMGHATFAATVSLQARSPWIGRTALKTALDGQIPGDGSDTALGIKNAMGRSSAQLHRFLDKLTERRTQLLEVELRKKAREKPKTP